MMPRIIVVEDEPLVRELYVRTLASSGLDAAGAPDAETCRSMLRAAPADLVMLDLGLPGTDGMTFARELRRKGDIGLVIVSRRQAAEDRVEALGLGCDDFLVKPVHLGELCARVQAVLRRRRPRHSLAFGSVLLDSDARTVEAAGVPVDLTRGEFILLEALARAGGRVLGREQLSSAVSRNPEESELRTVDALVRRIRRKLEVHGVEGAISTVPGEGYRIGLPVRDR